MIGISARLSSFQIGPARACGFYWVKSKERQAACILMTVRERLVTVKSQLSNTFRSYAAEFGIVGPAGRQNVTEPIKRVLEDDSLSSLSGGIGGTGSARP